eukprot:7057239-Pyramimonas_sp.AAC.1
MAVLLIPGGVVKQWRLLALHAHPAPTKRPRSGGSRGQQSRPEMLLHTLIALRGLEADLCL